MSCACCILSLAFVFFCRARSAFNVPVALSLLQLCATFCVTVRLKLMAYFKCESFS